MIVDYISNVNKVIKELNPDEKRTARNGLLNKIRNWNIMYDANDKEIMTSYSSDISDGYLITALPDAKLEETRNKSKYTYTMTLEEYSEFIDEYLSEVGKQRKRMLNSYSKSSAVLSDKLKEAKSEAADIVKEKYKRKFGKNFKKVG